MINIENYGWNEFFQNYYLNNKKDDFETGRVISIKGFKYTLITNEGEIESELSGKLLYATETEELPRVGDWVFFIRYESCGYIIQVFPRENELSRKNPGTKTGKQVLAANIDYALIVQGLDANFNLMRLDRYIVQTIACRIKPVIILNKVDLINDSEQYRNEINKLGRNCPVYFCSTYNQTGIEELKNEVLKDGKTYILIGSSGVGKSSLINSLTDDVKRVTGALSDSTGKGRHITTSRDLFKLPNGSLIIDTPGMKEFGIAFEESAVTTSGVLSLFPMIEKYAQQCRYSDCMHIKEDGCSVLEALSTGELEPKVYESYIKLIKEQKHFEITKEEQKRIGKKFGKMVREVNEYRKKYKY